MNPPWVGAPVVYVVIGVALTEGAAANLMQVAVMVLDNSQVSVVRFVVKHKLHTRCRTWHVHCTGSHVKPKRSESGET